MSTNKRITFTAVFLIFFGIFYLWCIFKPLCSNTIVSEAVSPDGKITATLFHRDCGATTSEVSIISLRKVNKKFTDGRADWIFVCSGSGNILFRWAGVSSLEVIHSDVDIFKKETLLNGVSIVYKDAAASSGG